MSKKIRMPFQKGEMIRAKADHSWVRPVFAPPDGDRVRVGDEFCTSIVLVRDWERVPQKSTPTARALRLADAVRSSVSHELNQIKIVDAFRIERNIANRHARAIIEKTTAERDGLAANLAAKTAVHDTLQKLFDSAIREADDVHVELYRVKAERDRCHWNEMAAAKEAQPDLESGRLQECLKRADATIVAMNESIAAVMRERDAALVESARMNADRDRIESFGDKVIRERDELAAKLATANDKRAELGGELTAALAEVVRLEDRLKERDAEIERLKAASRPAGMEISVGDAFRLGTGRTDTVVRIDDDKVYFDHDSDAYWYRDEIAESVCSGAWTRLHKANDGASKEVSVSIGDQYYYTPHDPEYSTLRGEFTIERIEGDKFSVRWHDDVPGTWTREEFTQNVLDGSMRPLLKARGQAKEAAPPRKAAEPERVAIPEWWNKKNNTGKLHASDCKCDRPYFWRCTADCPVRKCWEADNDNTVAVPILPSSLKIGQMVEFTSMSQDRVLLSGKVSDVSARSANATRDDGKISTLYDEEATERAIRILPDAPQATVERKMTTYDEPKLGQRVRHIPTGRCGEVRSVIRRPPWIRDMARVRFDDADGLQEYINLTELEAISDE